MIYDVIVIGSGIGGLYTCVHLDKKFKVLLLSKDKLDLNNTSLAQGGIAGVLDEKDSFKDHIADTLIAGNYKNNLKSVETMVKEGPGDIENLIKLGIEFDQDDAGCLLKTLEGGHSKRRIIHHKDKTGCEVVQKLIHYVKKQKNIDILKKAFVAEVVKKEDYFKIHIIDKNKRRFLYAKYVIFATGGVGKIYKYTTNSSIATGDGIAMAHRMGAKIEGMDCIQFHPTALNVEEKERFLISEAVRGEGGYLLNNKGERFMKKYDKRKELAPRDVVSKCIMKEVERSNSSNIYLDISYKNPVFLKNRFPNIYENCLSHGINITIDKIPVFPSQHYLMGGISVNINSESSIQNLYAVGECSNTGVHGNNRLASNSLLEGLVFSRRAAMDINKKGKGDLDCTVKEEEYIIGDMKIKPSYKAKIQDIMQNSYFVKLNRDKAIEGLNKIKNIVEEIEGKKYKRDKDYYETINVGIIGKLILEESIKNDQYHCAG